MPIASEDSLPAMESISPRTKAIAASEATATPTGKTATTATDQDVSDISDDDEAAESVRVHTLYEPTTATWQYVVADVQSKHCVIIDPVRDTGPSSDMACDGADQVLNIVKKHGYIVDHILDTNSSPSPVLSAGWYLRMQLAQSQGWPPQLCSDSVLPSLQRLWTRKYGAESHLETNLADPPAHNERIPVGATSLLVMHIPGLNTPKRRAFLIGECLFGAHSLALWREETVARVAGRPVSSYANSNKDVAGSKGDSGGVRDGSVEDREVWEQAWKSMSKVFCLPDSTRAYFDQTDTGQCQQQPYDTLAHCRSTNESLHMTARELFNRHQGKRRSVAVRRLWGKKR